MGKDNLDPSHIYEIILYLPNNEKMRIKTRKCYFMSIIL